MILWHRNLDRVGGSTCCQLSWGTGLYAAGGFDGLEGCEGFTFKSQRLLLCSYSFFSTWVAWPSSQDSSLKVVGLGSRGGSLPRGKVEAARNSITSTTFCWSSYMSAQILDEARQTAPLDEWSGTWVQEGEELMVAVWRLSVQLFAYVT